MIERITTSTRNGTGAVFDVHEQRLHLRDRRDQQGQPGHAERQDDHRRARRAGRARRASVARRRRPRGWPVYRRSAPRGSRATLARRDRLPGAQRRRVPSWTGRRGRCRCRARSPRRRGRRPDCHRAHLDQAGGGVVAHERGGLTDDRSAPMRSRSVHTGTVGDRIVAPLPIFAPSSAGRQVERRADEPDERVGGSRS